MRLKQPEHFTAGTWFCLSSRCDEAGAQLLADKLSDQDYAAILCLTGCATSTKRQDPKRKLTTSGSSKAGRSRFAGTTRKVRMTVWWWFPLVLWLGVPAAVLLVGTIYLTVDRRQQRAGG